MSKVLIALVLTIGVSSAFGVLDSLAVFTDQEVNDLNAFDTGTIVLDDSPVDAVITFTNMAPGDVVINPLTLTNNGTLALRYAMSTAASNADAKDLRDQLLLTVRTKTANPCASEDGAIVFGPLAINGAAIGSNAQGADTNDRTLAAAANEILCFKADLPLATGDAFQNAATTATFTFDAEQTVNNP